ncbi:MAG TPA: hypothetical protein VIJ94_13995 [Caulobacteraceae bacterium]
MTRKMQTASPNKQAGFLSGQLKAWAETIPALAAAAFCITTFFHEFVFRAWGLNFLQLATPQDVLMSGISSLALVVLVSLCSLLGLYLGSWLKAVQSFRLPIRAGIAALMLIFGYLFSIIPVDKTLYNINSVWITASWANIYFGILAGFEPNRVLRLWLRALLIVVSFGAAAYSMAAQAGHLIVFGFETTPMVATIKDAGASCESDVLWLGERNVVFKCRSGPLTGVRVLHGDSDVSVTLKSRPR